MLHSNIGINNEGHLTFAGADTVYLAKKYGTALYLLDENRIRERMQMYLNAVHSSFGAGSTALYASKALCFSGIYRVLSEEGMSADLVSAGEIYTAKCGGFNLENGYFHGNNKTDEDISFAIDSKIGHFIADNAEELEAISRIAGEKGVNQRVILRLTPGIDPHTLEAISTGKVDSKFGTAIETGQAREIVKYALSLPNITLEGFHCHIGSQCFDGQSFCDGADIMLGFIRDMRDEFGYTAEVLNLGGGFGVRYIESDPHIDIPAVIESIAQHIRTFCRDNSVDMPKILMEPGRSIVADAGMTLYTVGSVKTITGYKSYVSVDGGMTDNPRYALYKSDYTVYVANRADSPRNFECTVAGRCCESGDVIAEDIMLQSAERGDILAVAVTGAYNYSMASNYNRIGRPPIVMLKDGTDRIAVRRETYADMTALDC